MDAERASEQWRNALAWVGVACEVRAKNSLITEREIVLFALVNSTGLLKGGIRTPIHKCPTTIGSRINTKIGRIDLFVLLKLQKC